MKKTSKKILALLLAVLMLVVTSPAKGFAEIANYLSITANAIVYRGTCGENVQFTLDLHEFGACPTWNASNLYLNDSLLTDAVIPETVKNTVTAFGTKMQPSAVTIRNFSANKTVDYRATVTFTSDVTNGVSGGAVHWFINGQDKGTGDTYTEKEAKASYTVQAKYMKDGKVLAESDTETVNVKTGFFARLKAFFRALFGSLPKVAQEFLGVEIIDRILP